MSVSKLRDWDARAALLVAALFAAFGVYGAVNGYYMAAIGCAALAIWMGSDPFIDGPGEFFLNMLVPLAFVLIGLTLWGLKDEHGTFRDRADKLAERVKKADQTITGFVSTKAAPVLVGTTNSPAFTDDIYAKISRPDAKTVHLPRLVDGTWSMTDGPGKPGTQIVKDGTPGHTVTEEPDKIVVVADMDIPSEARLYFLPHGGQAPSNSRPVPPVGTVGK